MKKIYAFSLALVIGASLAPCSANALFPTFDFKAVPESIISNVKLVEQYTKIKEATKTASDISNSIGAAGKTFSELTIDKAKEAQEGIDKAKKEADKINELRADVERRQDELEAKTNLINTEVERAKEYRSKMGYGSTSDSSGDYGSSGNPYDLPYGSDDGDYEEYNEDVSEAPLSQNDSQTNSGSDANVESSVEKQLPNRQEFGKAEAVVLSEKDKKTEEEKLLDEEDVSASGSAEENYGNVENKEGSAVENYANPEYLENAKNADEKLSDDVSVPSSQNLNQRLDKAKNIMEKAKTPSRGRQPFKKTSFYKNYELVASADITPKTKVYSGRYGDRFIIPQKLAEKCKIDVSESKDNINIEGCIEEMLSEMNDKNATAAEDAKREYILTNREFAIGTVAASMKIAVEAAQYEDEVLKPLSDSVASAGNTRDDISSDSLIKLKGGAEVVNKLVEATAHKLKYDAFRQLGYYKVDDYKNLKASSASDKTESDK